VRDAGKAQHQTQASIFGEQTKEFTFFEGAQSDSHHSQEQKR
jgi:hypothetical protein